MRVESTIDTSPAARAPLGMLGDAALARLAARGNQAAFAQIFRRYHQPLFRYCRAITGNGEDAADALQNTMVKAMRSLPGDRRTIELKPWLFRVAHNESVSLLRQRRPDTALSDGDGRPVEGPEAGIAGREDLRELMSDLRELPDRQRATVILRELNGLSFAEIASVFDTSTAAAKQAAYDGRVALQDYAEGRAMDCDVALRTISDRDRKLLAGRKLRGHLRSCQGCADFKRALDRRSAQLVAIAPALPPAAATALMGKLFGGGGGSAGGGSVGLSATGGKLVASTGALKITTSVAIAVTVAAGVVGGAELAGNDRPAGAADEGGGAASSAKASPRTTAATAAERRRSSGRSRGSAQARPAGDPGRLIDERHDGPSSRSEGPPGGATDQVEESPGGAGSEGEIRTNRPGLRPMAPGEAPARRRGSDGRTPDRAERRPRQEPPSTPPAGAPRAPDSPSRPDLPSAPVPPSDSPANAPIAPSAPASPPPRAP